MKKVLFAVSMAVVVVFTAAVSLCVSVLTGAQAVDGFSGGGMRIVLDAGHGGIDGGVVGKSTGVKESDLNLAITYQVKSALEEIGFETVLTRKTEAGLYGTAAKGFKKRDMQKRKELIEGADPDLLLSIHQNYYPSKSIRGAQVFYNKTNQRGRKLATSLQKKLNGLYKEEKVRKRTATSGDYFLLNCSDCPSVIVECGFLSNPEDEKLLIDEAWQKKLADTIASGVLAYFADVSA
jgi:N-acetylmuramoyl-L-alanine amidase